MTGFIQRTIAISSNVVRLVGDPKAAILFSQLIYWTRTGVDVIDHDGWIFKTREQWELETGLSRYEQASARKLLIDKGLLEENKLGMPSRLCYRVNLQALAQQVHRLFKITTQESIQMSLVDFRHNPNVIKTLLGHPLAFHRGWAHQLGLLNALFLSRLMQIDDYLCKFNEQRKATDKAKPKPRWMNLQTVCWEHDTGLTAAQQRYAIQALAQWGVIEIAAVSIPRKKTFMRINKQQLVKILNTPDFAKQAANTGASHQNIVKISVETTENLGCENSPTGIDPKAISVGEFSHEWIDTVSVDDVYQSGTPITQQEVYQSGIPYAPHTVSQNGTAVTRQRVSQNGTAVTRQRVSQNGTAVTRQRVSQNGTPITQQEVYQNGIPYAPHTVSQNGTPITQQEVYQNGIPYAPHTVSQNGTPITQQEVYQSGTAGSAKNAASADVDLQNQQLLLADQSASFSAHHRLFLANYTRTRRRVNDYIQQLQGSLTPKLSTGTAQVDVVVVVNSQKNQNQNQNIALSPDIDALVWPQAASLQLHQQRSAITLMRKLSVEQQQELLDELAGNLNLGKTIHNHLGWIRTMAKLATENKFIPELADNVARARARACAAQVQAQKLMQPTSSHHNDGHRSSQQTARAAVLSRPPADVVARMEALLGKKTKWSCTTIDQH